MILDVGKCLMLNVLVLYMIGLGKIFDYGSKIKVV